MIQVHRSESGQYVLIHPATQTVVVSDDVAAGYAAIGERVRGARDAPAEAPTAATDRWRAALPWALAIVLPFVWLVALHLSLGRLASELVVGLRAPPSKAQPVTRKELEDLRLEVARVESKIKEPKRVEAALPDEPDEGDEDEDLKPLKAPKNAVAGPSPNPAPPDGKAEAKVEIKPAEAKKTEAKKQP
jgi:hypothetical protein